MLAVMLLFAAPVPQDEVPVADPAPAKREKLICRSRVKTGSRTNIQQVCHAGEEWRQIRSEYRNVVERGQQQRGTKY